MAINLITVSKAPLVIKQRKTVNVKLLGTKVAERDSVLIDMTNQGLSDIQYIMKAIAVEETQQQLQLENDPTVLVVDNKEGGQLKAAKRKVEVFYGAQVDKLLIQTVERELMSSIRTNGAIPTDQRLGTKGNWVWMFAETRESPATPVKNVNKIKAIPRGSILILKPKSKWVGLADMFAARKDAGQRHYRWDEEAHGYAYENAMEGTVGKAEPGGSGGVGFMSKAVNKLKRSRLFKNFTVRVVFTRRFALSDELYSQGTPVVVISGKRNRKYARIKAN